MGFPKRNIRGLQDIRTRSGNVDRIGHPYIAYMKITCLEMEKARRSQERESAINRVNNIDGRFKEIEAEKAALLGALGAHEVASDETPTIERSTTPRRRTSGFKIRY